MIQSVNFNLGLLLLDAEWMLVEGPNVRLFDSLESAREMAESGGSEEYVNKWNRLVESVTEDNRACSLYGDVWVKLR